MDASGSHTTNSTTSGALGGGGAAVNASGESDFSVASFFIEKSTEVRGINLSLGLDVIPFTAEVDKLGGGNGFDATVEVGNVMTAYIQPTFNAGGDVSLFLKAGVTSGDVDISTSPEVTPAFRNNDTSPPALNVGWMYAVITFPTSTVASNPFPPPSLSTSAVNGITSNPRERLIPLTSVDFSMKKEATEKSDSPEAFTAAPPPPKAPEVVELVV